MYQDVTETDHAGQLRDHTGGFRVDLAELVERL